MPYVILDNDFHLNEWLSQPSGTDNSSIRHQLDLGYLIYNHAFNDSFHESLEYIRCSADIAITGRIKGLFQRYFFTTRTENIAIIPLVEKVMFN